MKVLLLLITLFLLLMPGAIASAQDAATPIPINLPSPTPTGLPPSPTPTQTGTSAGPATVEALSVGTNVRSQPDINSERIGQISPGQSYAVRAKRFDWFQIAFPDAPGGAGWVYKDVVTLTGDLAAIPEMSLDQVPTEDPSIVNARATLDAVSAIPGGIATQTAMALITPTGLFEVPNGTPDPNVPQVPGQILPTFTFPPFTSTPINIQQLGGQSTVTVQESGIPPIAPIVGLIGLGILGLTVSLLRRV